MKKNLLTGLLTLLPIALTAIVVIWLFNLLTKPFAGLAEEMLRQYEYIFGFDVNKYENFIYIASRVIVLIALFFFVLFLGFIANKFFFRSLIDVTHKFFMKIPIVRSIYGVSKEMAQGFLKTDKKIFSKTTLVPFPFKGAKAIGLVSGELPQLLQAYLDEESYSVFVPTSPHPISGFLLLTPKSETRDIPITTEEAIKFLISCGIVYPGEEQKEEKPIDELS